MLKGTQVLNFEVKVFLIILSFAKACFFFFLVQLKEKTTLHLI